MKIEEKKNTFFNMTTTRLTTTRLLFETSSMIDSLVREAQPSFLALCNTLTTLSKDFDCMATVLYELLDIAFPTGDPACIDAARTQLAKLKCILSPTLRHPFLQDAVRQQDSQPNGGRDVAFFLTRLHKEIMLHDRVFTVLTQVFFDAEEASMAEASSFSSISKKNTLRDMLETCTKQYLENQNAISSLGFVGTCSLMDVASNQLAVFLCAPLQWNASMTEEEIVSANQGIFSTPLRVYDMTVARFFLESKSLPEGYGTTNQVSRRSYGILPLVNVSNSKSASEFAEKYLRDFLQEFDLAVAVQALLLIVKAGKTKRHSEDDLYIWMYLVQELEDMLSSVEKNKVF